MGVPLARIAAALAGVLLATQAVDGFVGLDALPSRPDSRELVLFALPDAYEACLPLNGPCPADSSSLLVVPATGRRILWLPEGTELPAAPRVRAALRAVGSPPSDAAAAHYLVPLVDGTGAGLQFAASRLDGDHFVSGAPDVGVGADASSSTPAPVFVPVLAGPSFSAGAPASGSPVRLLSEPVVVDAGDVGSEIVPVLVVRRASPSRVAFAVRPDPAWHMNVDVLPLVGDDGVAGLVRYRGRVRLAVAAPASLDTDEVRPGSPARQTTASSSSSSGSGAPRDDDGISGGAVAALAVALAGAAAAFAAFSLRRRRARRSLAAMEPGATATPPNPA